MRVHTAALTVCMTVCAFNAFGWKIVREPNDQQTQINSIMISGDTIILVGQDGEKVFRISQLEALLSAPHPSPAVAPPPHPVQETVKNKDLDVSLRQAFEEKSNWFVLSIPSKGFKRLKDASYRNFREGEFLRGALHDKRLYLQDFQGDIYEPTWEINYDFSRFVIPAGDYIDGLKSAVDSAAASFAETEKRRAEAERDIYFYVDQLVELLKRRNCTRADFIDSNGDLVMDAVSSDGLDPNAASVYWKLRSQLAHAYKEKRRAERALVDYRKLLNARTELYRNVRKTYEKLSRPMPQ